MKIFKDLSLNKKILVLLFLVIELVLFVLIQTLSGVGNSIVCYSAIALCFCFACINFKKEKLIILVLIGLMATLVADLFLVVLKPQNQLAGMIAFSVTQMAYFIKIYFGAKGKLEKIIHLAIRIFASGLMAFVCWLVLKEKTDFLSMISIFYITNLALNIVFSIVHERKVTLFSVGLICFIWCDLIIGFQSAIGVYLNISESSVIYKIAFSSFNWAWFFYVPAQVLIALSVVKRKE